MKKNIFFIFTFILISSTCLVGHSSPIPTKNNYLSSFKTDGCTGVLSDLPNFNSYDDFAHCCIIHDVVYWIGGSDLDKSYSDEELKMCLNDAHQITKLTNPLTNVALSTIGLSSWGHGWTNLRYDRPEFTYQENLEIINKLKKLNHEKEKFNFQFRLNDKQQQYISFWLDVFLNGFKSDLLSNSTQKQ